MKIPTMRYFAWVIHLIDPNDKENPDHYYIVGSHHFSPEEALEKLDEMESKGIKNFHITRMEVAKGTRLWHTGSKYVTIGEE